MPERRTRRPVPPEMQAWIDEQMRHFKPADMAPAVRLIRQYVRADAAAAAAQAPRKERAA